MKLTQQQLEAHLMGAANILRGRTAGQDYKNYILSLMFYKRLSDQWEHEAGIVAILLGAVLVFFMFPKQQEEGRLLAQYHAEDTEGSTRPQEAPRGVGAATPGGQAAS